MLIRKKERGKNSPQIIKANRKKRNSTLACMARNIKTIDLDKYELTLREG
jgi:hypothetical protein